MRARGVRPRSLGEIFAQICQQVRKDRLTAEVLCLGVDRQLPAQDPDAERIVHNGADALSVFIVLATDKPVPLERCFGVRERLACRQIDRRPCDGMPQLLDCDVVVVAHVAEHHRA